MTQVGAQAQVGEQAVQAPDVTVPRGTVVLAATPIGNTADASARLVALLERADIVAAEDTRRLYALANRLGVRVGGHVVANHDHNERGKADGLLDQVEAGATVLVVSDAGMPTINDPGLAIVRRAIERGLPVTCAPGPSAVLSACVTMRSPVTAPSLQSTRTGPYWLVYTANPAITLSLIIGPRQCGHACCP